MGDVTGDSQDLSMVDCKIELMPKTNSKVSCNGGTRLVPYKVHNNQPALVGQPPYLSDFIGFNAFEN